MAVVSSLGSLCKVAVCQMKCSAVVRKNLEAGLALIRKAKQQNPSVRMVFLPECADFLPPDAGLKRLSDECLNEVWPMIQEYQNEARNLGVWISLGGVHLPDTEGRDKMPTLSHLLLEGGSGDIVHRYDKLQLFSLDDRWNEENHCRQGSSMPRLCRTPAGLLGACVCFDVRFSQLSNMYRSMGAQVLAYPSAFTRKTGEAGHWHVLLRARSLDTQCYVIAAAQCGPTLYGHSCVVDPWGRVISEVDSSEEEGFCVADIDLEYLEKTRKRLPMNPRLDIYRDACCFETPSTAIMDDGCKPLKFGNVVIDREQFFYETKLSAAFVNIRPVLPNHVLVVPKRGENAAKLRDLTREERADLIEVVNKVSATLVPVSGSCSVALQDGEGAGQTVHHVHFHVLPRTGKEFGQDNDELYRRLDSKDDNRPVRSREEMALEASCLRKLFQ